MDPVDTVTLAQLLTVAALLAGTCDTARSSDDERLAVSSIATSWQAQVSSDTALNDSRLRGSNAERRRSSSVAVKRAAVHVENERSLRTGAAILDLVAGIARATEAPVSQPRAEGITEVSVGELAEYVAAAVQRRLSARAMSCRR